MAWMGGCAGPQPRPVQLEEANVLPLELNENFEFRKVRRFFFEPTQFPETTSETVNFERRRYAYGAITPRDLEERFGNYYHIYWRARERADVTVRFEYRQAGLGNLVSAKELYYPEARGSFTSDFEVIGDEYLEFGRVTSWRALLIVDGRIVAFTQSFMWK